MNRLLLVGLALLAGLALFAVGVSVYFPGDAAARYVARRAEQGLGMPVTLSPIEPPWAGLSADKLEIGTAAGPLVARNCALISRATMRAREVLPRPGGP